MKVLRVLGCLWCHMEQLGGRRLAYMGPLPHTQSSESRPRRPFVECVWVWGRGPISHRGGRSVVHPRVCVGMGHGAVLSRSGAHATLLWVAGEWFCSFLQIFEQVGAVAALKLRCCGWLGSGFAGLA